MTGYELKQIREDIFMIENKTTFAKNLGYSYARYHEIESNEDKPIPKRLHVTILALRALHARNRGVYDDLIRILRNLK